MSTINPLGMRTFQTVASNRRQQAVPSTDLDVGRSDVPRDRIPTETRSVISSRLLSPSECLSREHQARLVIVPTNVFGNNAEDDGPLRTIQM